MSPDHSAGGLGKILTEGRQFVFRALLRRNHFLIGLLTVIAAGIWLADWWRSRSSRLENDVAIWEMGGIALSDSRVPAGVIEWENYLATSFRSECFYRTGLPELVYGERYVEIRFRDTAATDRDLKLLERFPELEVLDLAGTNVTDVGLECLSEFTELRDLSLDSTSISDSSAMVLASLKSLRRLSIVDTNISDRSICFLASLPNLEVLVARSTLITPDGVCALRKFRPTLVVYAGQAEMQGDCR